MRTLPALVGLLLCTASASAQTFRVTLSNACPETLQVAVHYEKADGNWISDGFFRIASLTSQAVFETRNPQFYVHYSDLNGDPFTSGSYREVQGRMHPFSAVTIKSSDPKAPAINYTLTLRCQYQG